MSYLRLHPTPRIVVVASGGDSPDGRCSPPRLGWCLQDHSRSFLVPFSSLSVASVPMSQSAIVCDRYIYPCFSYTLQSKLEQNRSNREVFRNLELNHCHLNLARLLIYIPWNSRLLIYIPWNSLVCVIIHNSYHKQHLTLLQFGQYTSWQIHDSELSTSLTIVSLVDKYDILEYSRVKATMVFVHLQIYLWAFKNTNNYWARA